MVRKLTPPVVAKIRARQRAGLNQTQIAAELGISQATVSHGLKEPAPKPARSSKRAARIRRATTPESMDDLRSLIAEHVRSLQDLAERAKRDKNTGVYLQLARAAGNLIKELARLTPAEPPDENASPDMVEAARRAREKILERVRRRAGTV